VDGAAAGERAPVEALILVDMQTGFLEGGAAISDAQSLISQLEVLLSGARMARALIVQLQNDGLRGAIDEPGEPGWRLHLPPMPDEPVLRKSSDDGFAGTRLDELLREHGVRRVVIGGLLSEMCVSATARSALARGLQVVLPHDAHGTYDLKGIPAATVARVAEHALGDGVELVGSAQSVSFAAPKT